MEMTLKSISTWTKWEDRKNIIGSELSGVYILAHLDRPIKGRAQPEIKEVVYIGETCEQSLLERWRQFDRSANGQKGHSGGCTYWEKFEKIRNNLFVAAIPVEKDKDNKHLEEAIIRFIERKLLLEYVEKWKKRPLCNKK